MASSRRYGSPVRSTSRSCCATRTTPRRRKRRRKRRGDCAPGSAFAFSAVAYTVIRAFGYAPPYLLIAAVRRRRAGPAGDRGGVGADPIRARDLVRSPRAAGRSVAGGTTAGTACSPRCADGTDDWSGGPPRLGGSPIACPAAWARSSTNACANARHHGGGDPTRARALLGDDLWTFLHEPAMHVPTPRQVRRLCGGWSRCENLSMTWSRDGVAGWSGRWPRRSWTRSARW